MVRLGELVFEASTEEGQVTVTKVSDLEGWVTFVVCPDDEIEWSNLRNNCYPLNGKDDPAPHGRWVVGEFVGKEGSSLNLGEVCSPNGFTNGDILALKAAVNMMFTLFDRTRDEEMLPSPNKFVN